MRPGQHICAELHCQKGTGHEHAKWSPVATASYRLLPDIQILAPIEGPDAHLFQKCFPKGVIGIRPNKAGIDTAVVVNPRQDTASREVLRHKQFKDKVQLARIRDHFIFSIESTGAFTPAELFTQSIDFLLSKCDGLKAALAEMQVII